MSTPWQPDPALQGFAARLTKVWLSYCKSQPVKSGTPSWAKFFSEADAQGRGLITFEEFDDAIRRRLQAKVKRYELLVFWKHVDADGSGQITPQEFMRLMYCIELSTWPDLTQDELDRCVNKLSAEADKWHHAGGNWFKIFNAIDADGNGSLSYDELVQCARGTFPGLRISQHELPEKFLQGLWKRLDMSGSIEVPVHRFMSFMRKHGSLHSMHRLTEYSKKKRGLIKAREDIGPAPERSVVELRAVVVSLEKALKAYCTEKAYKSANRTAAANWRRFFQEADANVHGRLDYFALEEALRSRLGKWIGFKEDEGPTKPALPGHHVEPADLRALWEILDPNKSGEVTAEELILSLYRLELDGWPEGNEQTFERVVDRLNSVVDKRLRCGGNWYKVFNLVDTDGSGRLDFCEMTELIRDCWSGLAIPPTQISDIEIRSLWKALDTMQSGFVRVSDFMVFMKRHGSKHSMHKLTSYSKKKRGLIEDSQVACDASEIRYDTHQMCNIATRLTLAIHRWLAKQSLRGVSSGSPQLWGQFIKALDTRRSARLNFGEFVVGTQKLLRIEGTVSDDELKAFWLAVDVDGSGEASAAEFDSAVYRLQVITWPDLGDEQLKRIVSVMNAAADKWHRAGGNWYKVFTACDEDGSGNMDFEEMVSNLRSNFPGLSITHRQVSDIEMRGLWKALDTDRSGLLDVKHFMVFMRHHGKEHSMHKLTSYSQHKRRLSFHDPDDMLGPAPERTRAQLRSIAQRLDDVLAIYWARYGVRINSTQQWNRFFSEADHVDKAGRFNFWELKKMLRARLLVRPSNRGAHEPKGGVNDSIAGASYSACSRASAPSDDDAVANGVTHDDLHALWLAINEAQKKLSAHDWHVGLYQLEVEDWPLADEATLLAAIETLSAAAHRWHRAAGNWYKVFNLVDQEGSGYIGFHEVLEMIRRPLPCLSIPPERLPDRDIRALWRVMDEDLSGEVTVTEFMVFMRRLEVKRGKTAPRPAAGSVVHRASEQMALARTSRVKSLTGHEAELLREALAEQSTEKIAQAYEEHGRPWQGFVSEWDWLAIVRDVLGILEDQLDDDAAHMAWHTLDPHGTGKVHADALFALSS